MVKFCVVIKYSSVNVKYCLVTCRKCKVKSCVVM